MGERLVKVWAWIAAAHDGDAPVSIAALCRAAVLRLGVDGASVTAVSGPVAREPVFASDEVSARLEEFQFTMERDRTGSQATTRPAPHDEPENSPGAEAT